MCEKFQIEKSPYQAILKNLKQNLSFTVVASIFSAFAQSYIKLIIFPSINIKIVKNWVPLSNIILKSFTDNWYQQSWKIISTVDAPCISDDLIIDNLWQKLMESLPLFLVSLHRSWQYLLEGIEYIGNVSCQQ